MTQQQIDEIRVRFESSTDYELSQAVVDYYNHARQDIPALLDALEEAQSRREAAERLAAGDDKYLVTIEPNDVIDIQAAKIAALERAIINYASGIFTCYVCVRGPEGAKSKNCIGCGSFTKWEFDEARFAQEVRDG